MSENKNKKKRLGDWGEDRACDYLKSCGYSVIMRNYRCPPGELDIVAQKEGILAFVEVKTRAGKVWGLPCQAVDNEKQRKLRLAADWFLKYSAPPLPLQPRMDIIEILIISGRSYIRHLENAF